MFGRTTWRWWGVLALLLACLSFATAGDTGKAIEDQYGLYPDYAATLRVQIIGQRLAQAAGLPNIEFQIFNDNELNAMALPDGRVYVTSRMATEVTDDELAFVLGHELTHVKEGHAQHQMSRATTGALLGAIVAAALGASDTAIRTSADIAGGLTFGHYSRGDENKADAGGVRLTAATGYDPAKAADAMQRLIDKYGKGDAGTPVLGWFATHPDSGARKGRILKLSAQLKKTPPQRLGDPQGILLTLDGSAMHARDWLHPYLAIVLTQQARGKAEVLPAAQYPMPMLPKDWDRNFAKKKDETPPAKDPKQAETPLAKVTPVLPPTMPRYTVTVSLKQVPAGGAATVAAGEGTAVEATLAWVDTTSGLGGVCTGIAQRNTKGPWTAQEELKDVPGGIAMLEDGKVANIEGTLEAGALRRAARGFAEVIEANGPVDHSAPLSVAISEKNLRVNGYIAVLRNNALIAEARVTAYDGKTATTAVLWGTHLLKKTDKIVAEGQ
jgi:Zn-dependent protease with chaperone function